MRAAIGSVLESLETRTLFGYFSYDQLDQQPTPLVPCDSTCSCTVASGASDPNGGPGGSAASEAPVRFFDGMPIIKGQDLNSDGLGMGWGQTRTWTATDAASNNGNGWGDAQMPFVVVAGGSNGAGTSFILSGTENDNRMEVVFGGGQVYTFAAPSSGSHLTYAAWTAGNDSLTWGGTGTTLKFTDPSGGIWEFNDVARDGSDTPVPATVVTSSASAYGAFKSYTSANGVTKITTTYDANNLLTSVTRTDGTTDVERYLYTYAAITNDLVDGASATPPQMLQSVEEQHKVGGSWSTVRRVDYTYYTGRIPDGTGGWLNDPNGRLGDLQFASTTDPATDLTLSGIGLSGTTATATSSAAHGLHVGDVVVIKGADQPEYDGTFVITSVPSSTTFTYEIDGSPSSSTATTSSSLRAARPIDTSYYRYDEFASEGESISDGASNDPSTTGGPTYDGPTYGHDTMVMSGLRTVVQGASFSRLVAMLPDFQTESDAAIMPYVNNYFTYERYGDHAGVDGASNFSTDVNRNYQWRNGYRTGSRYRVTQEVAQGGCSCASDGGQGTFNFNYTANYDSSTDPVTGSPYFGYNQIDTNVWRMKTTETLPDGNQNVVYTDEVGLPMLTIFAQLDAANAKSVDSMSIDGSTDVVTVSATGHGFNTGDYVSIQGSLPELYNGIFQVTRIDADTFSFVLPANYLDTVYGSDPVTPFGTITATKVLARTMTFNKYDAKGRILMTAQPSAVTGYDDTKNDLLYAVGGSYTYLASNAGRIDLTDYYGSTGTSISSTTPGGVAGYVQDHKVAQGQGGIGSATILDAQDYYAVSNGSATIYPVASHTVYGQTGGGDPRKTTYGYTWGTGTAALQMTSMTVTQPPIVAGQNGPASGTSDTTQADKTTFYYDADHRVVFTKDGDGYINYTEYDNATGAVTKTIQDTDTSLDSYSVAVPAGLSSLGGSHLRLTTTYTVDGLGRTTKVTDPVGNVTYMTYNDVNHETRTYAGWHSVGGGQSNTTGPVVITREYRPTNYGGTSNAIVYDETITATILPKSSLPTGNEDFSSGGTVGGSIQTLSRTYQNNASQTVRSDKYFSLSGTSYSTNPYFGVGGTNYYSTTSGYDDRGRQAWVKLPTGTITHTVYDGLGRVSSLWVGTNDQAGAGGDDWSPTNQGTNNNMVDVEDFYYDGHSGSTTAVGDGNLTRTVKHTDQFTADRNTEYYYDWRDRLVAEKDGVKITSGAVDTAGEDTGTHRIITYKTIDNQGEVTQVDTYAADQVGITTSGGVPQAPSSSKLRARVGYSYDDQGRLYRTDQYDVTQSGTSAGSLSTTNTLSSQTWFNHRGLTMSTAAPGGLVTKYAYDGAGRVITQYQGDGGQVNAPSTWRNWTNAASVANDLVAEQIDTTYDLNGNVTLTKDRQRFHDDATNGAGLGALGDPSTNPKARVYYTANWYDAADRLTDSLDVGTNGGTTYTRGSTPTSGSSTQLWTHMDYDAAGRASTVTDPRGNKTLTLYDMLGRTTRTVNAWDGSTNASSINVSGTSFAGTSVNQTTEYTYDGSDHVLTLSAWDKNGTNVAVAQVTQYAYGVNTGQDGNYVNSNDLLYQVHYPDGTTGAASTNAASTVTYAYNKQGDDLRYTDQNGTRHIYAYDVLGRNSFGGQTNDGATVATGNPQGVATNVTQIAYYYNDAGQAYLFTSYNGSGGVVNQVERLFNGLGQVVTEYQEHNGQVVGGSSAAVQYTYSEMSGGANHSRLTSMTYPNGRVLNYTYGSGLDTSVSRVTGLSEGTGTNAATLEGYSYLGLNTIVKASHPNGIDLTYIKQTGEANGDGGDQYIGLDRFGRVADQRYLNTTSGTNLTATDRFQYGYDANSNVLYKNNLLSSGNSELYHTNGASAGYDALNRLTGFARGTLSDTNSDGVYDTAATTNRTQAWTLDSLGNWNGSVAVSTNGSAQSRTINQKNQYTAIGGATSPTYDNDGNTTTDETGKKYVYDAWNRLVTVKNSGGTTLSGYQYDALGRKVSENPGTQTDIYYGGQSDWQDLEERQGSTIKSQNVWSQTFIDDLVLRDRDADNNSGTGSFGKGGSGLEERLYAQHDANHDVTAITDTSGNVQERFQYDPYGASSLMTSSWGSTSDSKAWVFRYQGGRLDSTSGFEDFRNREYSPTLGRWVQSDPAGYVDGASTYQFVQSDPIASVDFVGLAAGPRRGPGLSSDGLHPTPGGFWRAGAAGTLPTAHWQDPTLVDIGGNLPPNVFTNNHARWGITDQNLNVNWYKLTIPSQLPSCANRPKLQGLVWLFNALTVLHESQVISDIQQGKGVGQWASGQPAEDLNVLGMKLLLQQILNTAHCNCAPTKDMQDLQKDIDTLQKRLHKNGIL